MAEVSEKHMRVTPEVRKAIQDSGESIRALAKRYGLNPKTVAKWRTRPSIEDRKAGPKQPKSTVLTDEEEAIIIAFRRYLPLPLDDCFHALKDEVPRLTRSSLHRCLQRHGVSRQPMLTGEGAELYGRPPGCFHIHIFEVRYGGGQLYLFTAVDQASKFVFGQILDRATQAATRDFLLALIDAAPCAVREVLTDDRMQFTTPGNSVSGVPAVRRALERGEPVRPHPFEYVCAVNDIEHHLVPSHYPWTEEQGRSMERISSTLAFDQPGAEALSALVRRTGTFFVHFNESMQLGILGGLTPYDYCRLHGPRKAVTTPYPAMGSWDKHGVVGHAASSEPGGGAGGRISERRSRDPGGTREAILEAARGRLAKDGPEGLSLSEVARLAGVNRGTAYQHFKTRENLIAATSEWVSEKLYQAVFGDAGQSEGRPVGTVDVAQLVDRLSNFAMDNPDLCRAWLLQVLSSSDPASDMFWREYQGSTARFVQTGLAQDNIDSEVLSVIMLAGAFLWPIWAQAQAKGKGELRPLAHRFAQECLRISMYGNLHYEHYPQIAERLKRGG